MSQQMPQESPATVTSCAIQFGLKPLGNLATRFAFFSWLIGRLLPNPQGFFGWKAYDRLLLTYDLPAARLALANDTSVVEQVLADRLGTFPKSGFIQGLLRPLIGNGLFGKTGGDEVKRRRKSYQRVLSAISNEAIQKSTRDCLPDYLARWLDTLDGIPVPREMSRLTIDIVTEAVFGVRFSPSESQRFVDLFFQYHVRCNPSVLFCSDGHQDQLSSYLDCAGLNQIGDSMRLMVYQRFIAPWQAAWRDPASFKCNLPPFMQSLLNEVGDIDVDQIDELMLDEISVMILAGHETSASVLSWLFWEMANQPVLLQDLPATGDVERDVYLQTLISEALRLYPPIAFYLRDTVQSTEFRGKAMPAGSAIAVSAWTLQRHKQLWTDASSFCPARWTKEAPKQHRSAYIPFGFGARFCPGKNFAEVEMQTILEETLRVARVSRVSSRVPKPLGNLTSRPDHDFILKFTKISIG